jgi:hypothetical protein
MTRYILGLLSLFLVSACEGPEFVKDSRSGEFRVKDNAYARRLFVTLVDHWVEREKSGRPPLAGDPTWNAYWIDLIGRQKRYGVGDVSFYVNYVIEARRKAGLPELRFRGT